MRPERFIPDAQSKARLQLAIKDWLRGDARYSLLFEHHLGVANVPGAEFEGIDMGKEILTADQVSLEAARAAAMAVENAMEHAKMSNLEYREEGW